MILQGEKTEEVEVNNNINKEKVVTEGWKKKLLCDENLSEEQREKVVLAKEEWRASLVSKLTEETVWKAELLMAAVNRHQAHLIFNSIDDDEARFLGQITPETYWKLNQLESSPQFYREPGMLAFLARCGAEDLALELKRCSRQWQRAAVASRPQMEVWRAACLADCTAEWQAAAVLAAGWEQQIKELAGCDQAWQGAALARVPRDQPWKLEVVSSLDFEWQVEAVIGEQREKVAKLLAGLTDKARVMGVLACQHLPEWKVAMLGKEPDDWKFDLLLSIDDEEMGLVIDGSRCHELCTMLATAQESWRLHAVREAAGAGLWLGRLVTRVAEEWQARLVLLGIREKMEKWRIEQIPDIKHENIAVNFLFCPGAPVPRWKFQLGLEVARTEDPLAQQKAELMFRPGMPQWKVEMAAQCIEGWRLAHLDRVSSQAIGQLFMAAGEEWRGAVLARETEQWRAELVAGVADQWKVLLMLGRRWSDEQWRLNLVAPLTAEWQVKYVLGAAEVWKAEMLAGLGPEEEMRGRELLDCSTRGFAEQVLAGFLDIYYT
jgi:hypothetical protein